MWNIDSYHILTKRFTVVEYVRLSSIVPWYQRILVKYLVCHCTDNRESSWRQHCHHPGCHYCRDHSNDKVSITTIFDFRYFKYASSDRMTESAQHSASHFVQQTNFLWEMSHKCVNCVSACREIWYWFIQIHLDKPNCAISAFARVSWHMTCCHICFIILFPICICYLAK